MKAFKMSDLGALNYYLGIEVQQSTIGITICQGVYAKKLLETAGLADSNPTRTPMEAPLKLSINCWRDERNNPNKGARTFPW